MRFDAHGFEVLDREECLKLLSSVPLGRIVFTDRALPAIQPVNFALDDGDVVIFTQPGSRLGRALKGSVVAFEADRFDETTRVGWSVTVIGQTRAADNADDLEELIMKLGRLWPPGPRERCVRISCQHISGRRIRPASAA